MTWPGSLLYGLVSGIAEVMPLSAAGHRTVLLKLLGASDNACTVFAARIGALAALAIVLMPTLRRLRRSRSRRRMPDRESRLSRRVLMTAAPLSAAVSLILTVFANFSGRLWFTAGMLLLSGFAVYIPQFFPRANKTACSMSRVDALLIGMAGGFGRISGLSGVGLALSCASRRGVQQRYALELSWLICGASLALCTAVDLAAAAVGAGVGAFTALNCILSAAGAFCGAFLGAQGMKFLSVKAGFLGFAYYLWGVSLFTLIIYLI